MEFSSHEDIEAPIDFVFAQVSDFPSLERSALRRGADVQRTDDLTANGPGMTWSASYKFRGKQRKTQLELLHYDPPNGMSFVTRSNAFTGDADVDLVALSRTRTRLTLSFELKPQSLSARLLVQSLKLARGSLSRKMDARVRAFARDLEERYHRIS